MLRLLQNASPSQRHALLRTISPSQLHSICEICHNILHGHIPVNVSKLNKYKRVIRKLADKKVSKTIKKRLLGGQTGGFLPYIIPAVISTLGSLFRGGN